MGRNVKDSDYEAILKKLNLGYLLERFSDVELDTEMVAKLSGGEKQRIALERAMVGKPQVYLLDEITSSLDEQNAREMEEILLAEDAMVLYVCHKIIPELKGQYEMLTFQESKGSQKRIIRNHTVDFEKNNVIMHIVLKTTYHNIDIQYGGFCIQMIDNKWKMYIDMRQRKIFAYLKKT